MRLVPPAHWSPGGPPGGWWGWADLRPLPELEGAEKHNTGWGWEREEVPSEWAAQCRVSNVFAHWLFELVAPGRGEPLTLGL